MALAQPGAELQDPVVRLEVAVRLALEEDKGAAGQGFVAERVLLEYVKDVDAVGPGGARNVEDGGPGDFEPEGVVRQGPARVEVGACCGGAGGQDGEREGGCCLEGHLFGFLGGRGRW